MLGVFAGVAASVPRQPPGVASALRRSDRCSRQLGPTGDETGDACRAALMSRSRWSVESTPSLGCPGPMRSRRVVKRPPTHIKSPHRTDLLRETPRALNRPRAWPTVMLLEGRQSSPPSPLQRFSSLFRRSSLESLCAGEAGPYVFHVGSLGFRCVPSRGPRCHSSPHSRLYGTPL